MVGAIILAAGSSKRFGADKRQAALGSGRILLAETIYRVSSCVAQVLVVLGLSDTELAKQLQAQFNDQSVSYFQAPDSAKGIAHSLANAMSVVDAWDAALICLGDIPFLKAATIKALLTAYHLRQNEPAPIIIPAVNGVTGHPVIFSHQYFAEISLLSGDTGAKPIIQSHPEQVTVIEVQDPGILRDIDTPADLAP